jgi:hypothetical protein
MSPEESIWDRDTSASGRTSLVAADLKDAPSLAWKILHATDEVSKHLRGQLPGEAKEVLQSKTATVEQLASTLVPALNTILDRAALYDPVRFRDVSLAANTRWLLSQGPTGEERSRLNRLLLADAYPKEVEAISGWNWRPAVPPPRLIPPGIVWEYLLGPETWRPLATKDGTDSLRRSGMIGFDPPGGDWPEGKLFNTDARWIRARWTGGDVESAPRLKRVVLNGVEVEQFFRDERTVGTSDGDKHQTFTLDKEILDHPEVWVTCTKAPAQKDVPVKTANESLWERWTEVRNNFRRSEITDDATPVRHFTAELGTGTIRFGDGVRGSIPPERARISVVYRVTAGAAGNVGPNTITVLDDSITGVQVTNIHAASGGADRESIDAAGQRGPWDIKHRDRAVTAEDFVQLALRTSSLVGKAGCFVLEGVIHVVVVPRDSRDLPQPSRWLIEDVDKQLRERKLINTLLRVEGPTYEAIDLEIDIVLEPSWRPRFAEARAEIEKELRRFIHPIEGMLDKTGWEMGRTLHLSELYYCLEQVEHVDHVKAVRFRRSGSHSWSDTKISVGERSFPCFSGHLEIRHTLE